MSFDFTYIARLSVILFVSLVGLPEGISQTVLSKAINDSNNLPSKFVYRTLEDMDGNIWLCTDGGVCKYDGKTMKCYTQKDGLPDRDIYKITLDELGRIWLFHTSNKIAFIQKDSIHVLPTESTPTTQRSYYSVGGNQGINIGSDFYMVDQNNKVSKETKKINILGSSDLIWSNYLLTYNAKIGGFAIYNIEGDGIALNRTLPDIDVDVESISQYHQPTNTFQIFTGDRLYIYDTSFVQQEVLEIKLDIETNILSALKDSWGNLWICTRDGLYFQSYNHRMYNISHLPELQDENVEFLIEYDDELVIVNNKGSIYKYSENEVELFKKLDVYSGQIYNIERSDKDLFLSTGLIGLLRIDLNDNSNSSNDTLSIGLKDFVLGTGDQLFSSGYYFKSVDLNTHIPTELSSKNFYKAIAFNLTQQKVWINTHDSLYIYNTNESLQLDSAIAFPLIENIESVRGKNVMISTLDNKLYVCDPDNCVQAILPEDVFVKSIKVLNDKVWLNTTTGILTAVLNEEDDLEYSFDYFFDYAVLGDDVEVNDISLHDGKLFLATENGVVIVNELDTQIKGIGIPVSINRLNNKDIDITDMCIDYSERNIVLEYGAKYFDNRNQLYYDYIFQGVSEDTITTKEEVIRYNDLSPGRYIFHVRARDSFGNIGAFNKIDIEVSRPWFLRPIVYILLLLLLISIGYLIFRSYWARVHRKNALQQQFAELELSALQSQMNPHFVFNAMNSIQNLISSDRPDEADLYVTRLANLMRKYLDSSREKYISIKEELNIISLYIQLEQLRFGNKISYHIDNKLDSNTLAKRIPATIVQPFVENSLKHGLFHKVERGNLFLRLYNDSEYIYIEIEDDGVGRKRVKEIQAASNRTHKSTGIESIERKLKVLRKLDKLDINYVVIDLYTKAIATGTKVIITISNK